MELNYTKKEYDDENTEVSYRIILEKRIVSETKTDIDCVEGVFFINKNASDEDIEDFIKGIEKNKIKHFKKEKITKNTNINIAAINDENIET